MRKINGFVETIVFNFQTRMKITLRMLINVVIVLIGRSVKTRGGLVHFQKVLN